MCENFELKIFPNVCLIGMYWFILLLKPGMWKPLIFCGSGSKLGSIWLFEEPEVEAFFHNTGAGMWKRLNFCGSGSTLKKDAGSSSKLGSDKLYTELETEAKNILLLSHPWLKRTKLMQAICTHFFTWSSCFCSMFNSLCSVVIHILCVRIETIVWFFQFVFDFHVVFFF